MHISDRYILQICDLGVAISCLDTNLVIKERERRVSSSHFVATNMGSEYQYFSCHHTWELDKVNIPHCACWPFSRDRNGSTLGQT